jgi:hypothetical protein
LQSQPASLLLPLLATAALTTEAQSCCCSSCCCCCCCSCCCSCYCCSCHCCSCYCCSCYCCSTSRCQHGKCPAKYKLAQGIAGSCAKQLLLPCRHVSILTFIFVQARPTQPIRSRLRRCRCSTDNDGPVIANALVLGRPYSNITDEVEDVLNFQPTPTVQLCLCCTAMG